MRPGSEAPTTGTEAEAPAAIQVEGLSVVYKVRRRRRDVRRARRPRLSGNGAMQSVQALEDVSLTVPQGSIFGVIGKNGAGKSTLLRAIAGIIPPSQGRIVVRGDITPLLSLGIGFNKALTGRENIQIGMLQSGFDGPAARELLDEILDFTELDDFIDYPVRSYSSGMKSRLGFAVAAFLDPEILLIDEALAVGDQSFKVKCRKRMEQMCGEGRTVVIVTHGMGTILEMASRCLWLHKGRTAELGEPKDVVEAYMRFSRGKDAGDGDDESWDDDLDDSFGGDDL